MEITTQIIQQVSIITVNGDIDRQTAPALQTAVQTAIPAGAHVLLDLSRASYLSSAGLRVLLAVSRYITERQGRLALVGVHGEIKTVLEITGLFQQFVMAATIGDGLDLVGHTPNGSVLS
jgi:anti-sigma B factor antagonist